MVRIIAASFLAAGLLSLEHGAAASTIVYPGTGFAIPDNSAGGSSSSIIVPDGGALTNVSITLTFSPNHTWVGDLIATLSRDGTPVDLVRRIGKTSAASGLGDNSNVAGPYTFVDAGPGDFAAAAAAIGDTTTVPAGSYFASTNDFTGVVATTNPSTSLNGAFGGLDRAATWTLFISDNAIVDTGSVSSWSLSLTTQDEVAAVPEPSTMFLAALGLVGFGLVALRRRRMR